MSPRSGRPTIADVAREAGVSVPTVSKVLNNRPDIAETTRRRVERVIVDVGYQRRPAARRRTRAGLVDLVVRAVDSAWAQEVIGGAEEEAYRAGIGLVVTATHGDEMREQWVRTVVRRRSDGVVLAVTDLAGDAIVRLTQTHVPVVLLDRTGNSDPRLPSVGAANWSGALAATEHLLGLGHRRIAIISGHPRLACSGERIDGYLAALRRAGVEIDPDLVLHGDFYPDGGRAGAARLLSLENPPTAIFAGSDLQALGVYDEARRRGLQVPRDLSVVGFDDLSVAGYVTPGLTTVRQPHAEMAAQAVRTALEVGRNPRPGPPARIELATHLVERESTAPPRR